MDIETGRDPITGAGDGTNDGTHDWGTGTSVDGTARSLSRRAAVQGIGVLAGATVLAVTSVADPRTATASPLGSVGDPPTPPPTPAPTPTAEPVPAPAPLDASPTADLVPVTGGLTYVNFTVLDFSPHSDTAVTANVYGLFCAGFDLSFFAPLQLPSGSIIKELSFAGRNTSPNTAQPHISATAFGGGSTLSVAQALLTSGPIGIRTATNGVFSHVVDGQYGYYLVAPTMGDGSVTIHGARVGYVPASTPGTFHPLAVPVRIYDSRPAGLPAGGVKGKFANHEERVLDATLGTGVPAGASSVLVNIAATNTNPGGFFSLFKNGVAWPNTSTLNWGVANTTVSTLSATQVAAFGNFKARCEGAGGADLIVDVVGWFS